MSEDHKWDKVMAEISSPDFKFQHTPEEFALKSGVINDDTRKLSVEKCRASYDEILGVLRKYCDLPPQYYPLIALWVIGTYIHKEFETFPLLFINASKGSGKSRLLRLIISLSRNGKTDIDLREAVLFRTAENHTIGIDEFEGVGSKEAGTLRTMINAAYKKGTAVERMKKVSKNGKEEQVVERFNLYTPLVMANIWGLEEVLSDRCITIILEHSEVSVITKLIEDFERNPSILGVKRALNAIQCSLCSVVTEKNIINRWNDYIIDKYKTTLTTYTPESTQTTLTTLSQEDLETFNKIDGTGINGRNLELFFPIFIIARIVGQDIFDEILELARKVIKEKKSEEFTESKDVTLIDFLAGKPELRGSFVPIVNLTREFKLFATAEEEENKWLNSRWMGRALKRAKIIIGKRRMGTGIEVMIDVDKAKRKIEQLRIEIKESDNG